MKLRKAKRFNTVESYAACACMATTCSCSCGTCSCGSSNSFQSGRDNTDDRTGQNAFDRNHYDADAVYWRG